MSVEIIQGDCLVVMPLMDDNSVDAIVTDLPYGITECGWDSIIPLNPMWKEAKRIIKPAGVIVMTASQPFTSILVCSNREMFKHEWIWIKNRGSNFANTVREPMKEHETVLVFAVKGWTFNKQMQSRAGSGADRIRYDVKYNDQKREGTRQFAGRAHQRLPELRVPCSWQKFNTASGKEKTKHPTQKPVALMEYLVKTYSNEDEMVLDFAMGSGTTGVACGRLNRNFIGIEKEAEYCEIARRRIAAEKDKMGLFVDCE